jgi:N-succinyldiaminopimelate aminotransferase
MEAIATACVEHDLICVSDEVYEHFVYDGKHIPPATLPGMAERTLTISSVGKSFSFTGWKIGWCSGPSDIVAAARMVKQHLTFAGGTPLQHAAAALRLPPEFLDQLRDELRARRDQLCAALVEGGMRPIRSGAGWSRSRPARSTTTRLIACRAEGAGFEPAVRLHGLWFSRPAHSTTLPPLR